MHAAPVLCRESRRPHLPSIIDIPRRAAEMQHQHARTVHAGEQIAPARAASPSVQRIPLSALERMESIGQRHRLRHRSHAPRASASTILPHRHAERSRIPRQAELLRHRGARADAHAPRPRAQAKHHTSSRRVQSRRSAGHRPADADRDRRSAAAPGADRRARSNRRQIASTTGPPVSTGAQGGCGGRSQPALAFWNSQRLPSSR